MASTTNKKRLTIVGAIVVALIAVGGVAVAYWSSTGTGAGQATTGTSQAFVITSSPPTGAALAPGGPAQTVAFTVANPSTGSQSLTNVTVTVANSDGSPWTAVAGCSALDYTVGTPTITYGQIAPGANVAGTVSISMNNLPSNQDACQGVAVPLYFVAS